MDHYDLFSNENEVLIGKLYDTYLEFFKTKKEFVESRDEFMKVLAERFPEEYKTSVEETSTVIKEGEESEKSEKSEKEGEEAVKESEKAVKESEEAVKEGEEAVKEGVRTSALFHKIALYAHPDKHKNVNPILFHQSVKACEKGKFGKLCFLAKFMNISFDTLTSEEIQCIKETIQKKEQKIQHYNRTYSMIYKKSKNEQTREQLIEAFQKIK
jgi:hypothetical protein